MQICTDIRRGVVQNIRMLTGEIIERQAVKVRCPTCGVGPGTRCELAIGGPRPKSHLERRLIASDRVKRTLKPVMP